VSKPEELRALNVDCARMCIHSEPARVGTGNTVTVSAAKQAILRLMVDKRVQSVFVKMLSVNIVITVYFLHPWIFSYENLRLRREPLTLL
jgi:hypothetical protein